jgi:predicted ferric reductase
LKEIWVLNKNNKYELYSNPKKLYVLKIVLLACFFLFGYNSYNIFTNKSISYLGIISNGLLAISMILQIRNYKKENKMASVALSQF